MEQVLSLRRDELAQMQAYVHHAGCLMEFLLKALDDPTPSRCGRCANCRGKGLPAGVSPELVIEAQEFLKGAQIPIEPRKQWPVGLFPDQKPTIPADLRCATGRSLCYYGDAGWGKLVRVGKYQFGCFSDQLIDAAVQLIQERWRPDPFPEWVTAIPSTRHPTLVPGLAARIGEKLSLPYLPVLQRSRETLEQKTMQNSSMQAHNVLGSLMVEASIPEGPVLLVDDIIDSGWTLTMAGYLLRQKGCCQVYPFTLARATGRNVGP
jgi:ATP-dependent DNA helicase RecQ